MCQYIVYFDLESKIKHEITSKHVFQKKKKKNALTNKHNEDNDYEVMIIIMIINKIHIRVIPYVA